MMTSSSVTGQSSNRKTLPHSQKVVHRRAYGKLTPETHFSVHTNERLHSHCNINQVRDTRSPLKISNWARKLARGKSSSGLLLPTTVKLKQDVHDATGKSASEAAWLIQFYSKVQSEARFGIGRECPCCFFEPAKCVNASSAASTMTNARLFSITSYPRASRLQICCVIVLSEDIPFLLIFSFTNWISSEWFGDCD